MNHQERLYLQKKLDEKIAASWDLHNDDDISIKRLFAMVEDDCKCDTTRITEAMVRLGKFMPVGE